MKEFDNLVKIVKILRSKRGCPWDRAQKISNYKKYLLEEVYELIDELEKKDFLAAKEELGDIFLILVAIANILEEKKKTNLKDILKSITEKLIQRHPHVFGKQKLKTPQEVYQHWIKQKAETKKRKALVERLPKTAPSLLILDLFLKELNTLTNNEEKLDLSNIKDKIESFVNNNKKDLIYEIIFDLAKLAHKRNINLELGLKKFILKKSKKISYK